MTTTSVHAACDRRMAQLEAELAEVKRQRNDAVAGLALAAETISEQAEQVRSLRQSVARYGAAASYT